MSPSPACRHFTTLFHRRLQPAHPLVAVARDDHVQGLRAFATLLVMPAHVFIASNDGSLWARHFGAGRGGVLLFFVISGYVIGLVNQRPWAFASRADYWRRRLTRLAPLYVLAVLFSLFVAWWLGRPPGAATLIANLLCLQNFQPYGSLQLSPIWTDTSLWTLHFEMVYYALFLLVWRLRPTLGVAGGITVLATAMGTVLPAGWSFPSSYAAGFVFWLAGLALAWLTPPPADPGASPRGFPLAGLLLLLIATHHAAPAAVAFAALGCDPARFANVSVADFAYLPICVLLVGGATRRLPALSARWRLLCLLPPLLTVAAALAAHSSLHEPRWAVAAGCTLVGSGLVWTDWGASALRHGAWLGGLSYAFYLFHQPIFYSVRSRFPENWLAVASLTVAITFVVAWLLELKLQPLCFRRRPAA